MKSSLKNRILIDEAALRLFSEKGVSEISIKDLARETGLSEGGLYRHFTSKEELAARVFSKAYHDIAQHMTSAMSRANPDFKSQSQAIVQAIYTAFDTNPVLLRFLLLRQHDALPRIQAGQETPMTIVQKLIISGKESGDVKHDIPTSLASALFVGMVLEPLTFRLYGAIEGCAIPSIDITHALIMRAICKE